MKKLIRGLLDFQRHTFPPYRATFARLADGQSPGCLFISCADSRVVPNLFVSTPPGELFTVRNVGNLVPPASGGGNPTTDRAEGAAIEFALGTLPIEDVIVCGHSGCGAMKALLAGGKVDGAPNLERWLEHGGPSLKAFESKGPGDGELSDADRLAQLNVLTQLEHLRTYPIVREREGAGAVRLHGWWFDIGRAMVHAYRADLDRFVLIDEVEGEALLAKLEAGKKA